MRITSATSIRNKPVDQQPVKGKPLRGGYFLEL